jgi:hypothetical protein
MNESDQFSLQRAGPRPAERAHGPGRSLSMGSKEFKYICTLQKATIRAL